MGTRMTRQQGNAGDFKVMTGERTVAAQPSAERSRPAAGKSRVRRALLLTSALVPVVALALEAPYGMTAAYGQAVVVNPASGAGGRGGGATGGNGGAVDTSGSGQVGTDGGTAGGGAGGGGAGVTGGAGGIGGSGGGAGGLGGATVGAAGGKGVEGTNNGGPAGNGNGGGGGGGGAHGYVDTAGAAASTDVTGGAGGEGGKGGGGLGFASAAGAGGGAGGGGAGAVIGGVAGNATWSHGATGGAGGLGGEGGGMGLAGNGGNGGNGGAGLVFSADVAGDLTVDGAVKGGAGGKAGNGGHGTGYKGKGGTGGAGGAGISYTATVAPSSLIINGVVSGGAAGGNNGGQASIEGNGGAGGVGGAGISYSGAAGGQITVNAAVTGGLGGTGAGGTSGPTSGNGGAGISVTSGASVNVNSAVTGGNGGSGYSMSYFNFIYADGGAGIAGSNLQLNVGAGGTLTGGLNGEGRWRAPAVAFTGGSENVLSFDNSITNSAGIFTGDVQIDSGAAVTFDRASDFNFSTRLAGTGTFIKKGDGTLTLSGSNTFYGSAEISGGTLAITNAGALRLSGVMKLGDAAGVKLLLAETSQVGGLAGAGGEVDISSGKKLNIYNSVDSSFAGFISGSGALTKDGAGKQTLTGDNTYTGGTTVSYGKLEIGNGGTSGSIVGNVEVGAGARFAFNRSDALTFAGNISGDGTFLKDGAGTLTLTGYNVLIPRGAAVASGTLQVGDGGTSGSLTANVTVDKGATLAFNRSDNVDFNGRVSGAGSLVKSGAGTLTLTVNNTHTGGTTVSEGTLRLGDGSTSGSIVGDVTVDKGANLAFNRSNAVTYDGIVSGAGALTKLSTGTLTLTGNSTHTGGTTVSGGMLQVGNGGTSGSIAGDVALGKGTMLAFNRSDAATYDGVVSGDGALVKAGAGTLTLSGKNTYTGGTAVSGGTLSGSTASIRGNLENGGTVIFDEAADATFEGNIQGLKTVNGKMVKQGAGQLTLAGSNNLDWSLQAGGVTTASDRFSGNLNLAAGTNFTFDQSYNGTYSGLISGDGVVRFAGGGLVLLSGDSSGYTGTSTIDTVTSVNGALGGRVNVGSGGTLKGNGTVGTTTLASGAIIAPGNSIGTLNVAGDLTYGAGSLYEVEIDSKGGSDRINVSGTATLNNAGLKVVSLDPEVSYQNGQTYTILSAGTLTGEFAKPTMASAFLTSSVSYSGNAAILSLQTVAKPPEPTKPTTPLFVTAAETANQRGAASGLDGLDQTAGSASLTLYNRVLFLDAANARVAFDQLSGEVHSSVKSGLIAESHQSRKAISDRITAAFENGADAQSGVSAWTTAYGSFADTKGDGNAASLDRNSGGFLIGADGIVTDMVRLGLVAGYGHSSLKVDERASSAKTDSALVGIYAGTAVGDLILNAGAAYSWNSTDTKRTVVFSGFQDTLDASYDSGTAQVFGEAAYRIAVAPNAYIEPFANLAYVNLDSGNVHETGGAAALHGAGDTTDTTFSTLGVRGSTSAPFVSDELMLTGMIGWRHAYGDVTPDTGLAFASGPAFTVAGAPLAKNTAIIEAGLDFSFAANAKLAVSYSGEFGSGVTDNAVRTRLEMKF